MGNKAPPVNWTPFDYPINNTVTCWECKTKYRSHAKWQGGAMWARTPCPECRCQRLSRCTSDPESMTVRHPDG